LEQVVVTPHLGASTREAQDKAGETIAEQVGLALAGEFVPFAVNVSAAAASETVRPFLPLAERLGGLFGSLSEGAPSVLEIEYQGQLADYDTRILTLSVLKGLFGRVSEDPVSYVNAPQFAAERGVEVRDTTTATARDYVNLITLRGGQAPSGAEPSHAIAGTLTGLKGDPRIVMLDDHSIDVPPARNMLVVRNDDRPGVIGRVGTILGNAGINIANMAVGQSAQGASALMVVSTTEPIDDGLRQELAAAEGILSVHVISRSG
jgi:D-3-phosphoglycerate dehydrogenase